MHFLYKNRHRPHKSSIFHMRLSFEVFFCRINVFCATRKWGKSSLLNQATLNALLNLFLPRIWMTVIPISSQRKFYCFHKGLVLLKTHFGQQSTLSTALFVSETGVATTMRYVHSISSAPSRLRALSAMYTRIDEERTAG